MLFARLTFRLLCAFIPATLLFPVVARSAPPVAAAAKMRPYSGIGVFVLPVSPPSGEGAHDELQLYDEPGLVRRGALDLAAVPRQEWIFGADAAALPLVVVGRKAGWLKIVFDDAGREAWINPGRRGTYQPWDAYVKGRAGRLLPGLQKRYYQLFRQPGAGRPVAALTPRQPFKLVQLEGDWAVVMPDPDSLSWMRWRDEDGRLLIGLEQAGKPARQLP